MALTIFGFLMVPVITVLALVIGREFRLRYVRRLRRPQVRYLMKMSVLFGVTGALMAGISHSFFIALLTAVSAVVAVWLASYMFPYPEVGE